MSRRFLLIPGGADIVREGATWYDDYTRLLAANRDIAASIEPPPDAATNAKEWVQSAEERFRAKKRSGEELSLIGHDLGGVAVLRYMEHLQIDPEDKYNPKKLGTVMLVGTPVGDEPIRNMPKVEAYAGGFEFDWNLVRGAAHEVVIYHAFDDEEVGVDNAVTIVEQFGVGAIITGSGGHFNTPDGSNRLLGLLPAYGVYT